MPGVWKDPFRSKVSTKIATAANVRRTAPTSRVHRVAARRFPRQAMIVAAIGTTGTEIYPNTRYVTRERAAVVDTS